MNTVLHEIPSGKECTVERTSHDSDVLARCLALDLTLTKANAMSKFEWPAWKAERVEQLYKRYLYLCYKHRGTIVPSSSIDEFWELHILDTKQYAIDCKRVFGFFLHHDPHFLVRNPGASREDLQARFQQTKRLFAVEFGEDMSDALMAECEECIPDYDPPNPGGKD